MILQIYLSIIFFLPPYVSEVYLCLRNNKNFWNMERFIKKILWAALVSAVLLLVACEKEPVVVEPRLDFENAVVEAPVEGGVLELPYVLEGAGESPVLKAVCDEEWLAFDFTEQNMLRITVNATDTRERRTADARIIVPGHALEAEVTVEQGGGELPDFTFTFHDITENIATLDIIPYDTEAGYITFLRLADEVGNLSDDELHELDVQYWIDSYYGMYGIEEIMSLVTLYGNKFNERMFSLVPDTEYCIYAYGVDAQGERLTPVTKAWFTTETLEMSDTSFEISVTKGVENEKGQIPVHITYKPDDNETNYLTGFTVWSEGMDMDALIEQQQIILNDFIVKNMTFGAIPLEDVIAHYYPAGEQSDDFTPMKDYEFVVYCMCVAPCGLINSEVIYKTFDTFVE